MGTASMNCSNCGCPNRKYRMIEGHCKHCYRVING